MKLDKTKIKARVDSLKVVKELRLKKELAEIMSEVDETSGRPGSKFSPGRDRDRERNDNPAGTGISLIPAGTGIFPIFLNLS